MESAHTVEPGDRGFVLLDDVETVRCCGKNQVSWMGPAPESDDPPCDGFVITREGASTGHISAANYLKNRMIVPVIEHPLSPTSRAMVVRATAGPYAASHFEPIAI
jgi:hypothetical protein